MKDLHVLGIKDDHGKPPVGLVLESFPHAILDVAKVSGFGANKYTRGGWQTVENAEQRYLDAVGRHLLAFYSGEHADKESNLPHLAHAAWGLLAVLELSLRDHTFNV
jgi:hypothetical protein